MIAKMRALRGFGLQVARAAAPVVEAAIRATAAAGTDPDGKPWPSKKDGGRALPNAASAVSVKASGLVLRVLLKAPYGFAQTRRRARKVIPEGHIPADVSAKLRKLIESEWKKTVGA